MTRNRKKLKTRTKANVSRAAAVFPASQRPLTGRASLLELQRLAIAAAARAEDEERRTGEDHGPERDQRGRSGTPAAARRSAGGPQRQHGLVGDLLAEGIPGPVRAGRVDAGDAIRAVGLQIRVVGEDEV